MQALVLVGGEGTRLRPLTLTQPKPAIRLVDRPFIRFMVDWLAAHGVTEVVMACGFRAEALRSALGDRVEGGPEIRYIEEPEPLGTAGPIRFAADRDSFRIAFSSSTAICSPISTSARCSSSRTARRRATLALYPVDDPAPTASCAGPLRAR